MPAKRQRQPTASPPPAAPGRRGHATAAASSPDAAPVARDAFGSLSGALIVPSAAAGRAATVHSYELSQPSRSCPLCLRPFQSAGGGVGGGGGASGAAGGDAGGRDAAGGSAEGGGSAGPRVGVDDGPRYFRLLAVPPPLATDASDNTTDDNAHTNSNGDSTNDLGNDNDDVEADLAASHGYYQTHFEEVRKIGHGAFGGVYVCRHVVGGVPLGLFAVKKIPVGTDAGYLRHVLREVRVLEELRRHPNVIEYNHSWIDYGRVADFGPAVRCLFILMEYATEGALDAFLEAHGAVLSDTAVWYFFLSAVRGLHHLHSRNILHRDIKPGNLLLTRREGGPPRVVLSDFGTAVLIDAAADKGGFSAAARTGGTGTQEYMAPELFVVHAPRGGVDAAGSAGAAASAATGPASTAPTQRRGTAAPPSGVSDASDASDSGVLPSVALDASVRSLHRAASTIPSAGASAPPAYAFRHTKAADVWALGVVLHFLAYDGTLPTVLPTGAVVLTRCHPRPPEMEELCYAMLRRDPSQRPTCDDILHRTPFVAKLAAAFEEGGGFAAAAAAAGSSSGSHNNNSGGAVPASGGAGGGGGGFRAAAAVAGRGVALIAGPPSPTTVATSTAPPSEHQRQHVQHALQLSPPGPRASADSGGWAAAIPRTPTALAASSSDAHAAVAAFPALAPGGGGGGAAPRQPRFSRGASQRATGGTSPLPPSFAVVQEQPPPPPPVLQRRCNSCGCNPDTPPMAGVAVGSTLGALVARWPTAVVAAIAAFVGAWLFQAVAGSRVPAE